MLTIALGIGLGAGAGSASANDGNVSQVPQGDVFSCDLCHQPGADRSNDNPNDLEFLTPFGVDVVRTDGAIDWAQMALLDSDGDCFTNGIELDADGGWADSGVVSEAYSDPNDPNATLAGQYDADVIPCGAAQAAPFDETGLGPVGCAAVQTHTLVSAGLLLGMLSWRRHLRRPRALGDDIDKIYSSVRNKATIKFRKTRWIGGILPT